ncbi:MAG: hypothetical protein PHH82_00330 [Candidatus ainarchaeum sp.]|nr:hypothetical protein [Candidatus ainarchaeum sp.]
MRFNGLALCFCVLLGLILISGFGFAEKPIFDEANSCFCKAGQNAATDTLCINEKMYFYFFNIKLDCSTEGSEESADLGGSSEGPVGSGTSGSSGKSGAKDAIGTKKVGETCKNSGECSEDLICAVYNKKLGAGEEVKLENLVKEGTNTKINLKSTKLKSGEYAYCSQIFDLRPGLSCDYDKDCPVAPGGEGISYCNGTTKKCEYTTLNDAVCKQSKENSANNFCEIETEDNKNFALEEYVCGPEFSCILLNSRSLGDSCFANSDCEKNLCKGGACTACEKNDDCLPAEFCSSGECKQKFAINEACASETQCLSGVCDPESKICKGGLHEEGCYDNSDCGGDLICDMDLRVCKKSTEDTICSVKDNEISGCPDKYWCTKNNIAVTEGIGDSCKQKFDQPVGSPCTANGFCDDTICVKDNKNINNTYKFNSLYYQEYGKYSWTKEKTISKAIVGNCGLLKAGGFCKNSAKFSFCENGLACNDSVCSVASTTSGKLSLLSACNYDTECDSGYCTQIGGAKKCSVSDKLHLSANSFTKSYGLISNTSFIDSVEDTEWTSGTKYDPDCTKAWSILNTNYTGNKLCEYMFGDKYNKCQANNGLCAEFEDKKYNAGLDLEENQITVRVLFEMSCIGGMTGYESDSTYSENIALCQAGNIKDQCKHIFVHETRKYCGSTGSNLVTFDLAGITFNPITDYAVAYTSEGGKEYDIDDSPGENFDYDDGVTTTNGEAECTITGVSQTYSNTEDELVSKIYVTCLR